MSMQAARVFWITANTDQVANVIKSKSPQALGLGFTAEEFKQAAVENRAARKPARPEGRGGGCFRLDQHDSSQRGCDGCGQNGCGQDGCGQSGCGQNGCSQGQCNLLRPVL